jgi:hypothetical protein
MEAQNFRAQFKDKNPHETPISKQIAIISDTFSSELSFSNSELVNVTTRNLDSDLKYFKEMKLKKKSFSSLSGLPSRNKDNWIAIDQKALSNLCHASILAVARMPCILMHIACI